MSLYLIEILHQTTTPSLSSLILLSCILSKFYIKPQPIQRRGERKHSCILSKFYIKPQHRFNHWRARPGCILSKFYIKPQPGRSGSRTPSGCILSKFYIKPQHIRTTKTSDRVVSYRNSTSNHNRILILMLFPPLYLIEILHQTTTDGQSGEKIFSCILSKFYIKPQP